MSNGETDREPSYPAIVTPVQLAADPMLGTTWDGESVCQCGVYVAIQVYRGGHTKLETLRGGVMAYGGAAGALAEFRGGEHALVCGELRLIGGKGRKANIAKLPQILVCGGRESVRRYDPPNKPTASEAEGAILPARQPASAGPRGPVRRARHRSGGDS